MSSKSSFFDGVKNRILPGRAHDDNSHNTKRSSGGHQEPLHHLPLKTLAKLTPEELQNYTNEQLERLPDDRLAVLPGETLSRLSPRRLAKLPVKAIEKLTTEALLRLPPEVLAGLTNHFLANITTPEVLFRALPALHPEDLRKNKIKQAIHRIGHEKLRTLPSEVKRRLPIPVDYDAAAGSAAQQLPIQKNQNHHGHDISIHPLNTFQGLPAMMTQSSQDFGMPAEYLDSGRHEQQQQQQQQQPGGVVSFDAYNPAGIDPSAFSSAGSPPSPTATFPGPGPGRSSPGAVKSLACCQSSAYQHPPRASDNRPSYGPRRNSSVSKGSHTRARSSSRGPRQERERDREYQAWRPDQVSYVEPGPIQYSDHTRVISEAPMPMDLPTPPVRSSSRIDAYNNDLSPSEVIRRAETWKDDHRESQISRKERPRSIRERETPRASRDSIVNIREEHESSTSTVSSPTSPTSSTSPTSPTSASAASPEAGVASFADHAERKRAATSLGHHPTSSPALDSIDPTESSTTNQAIQNHTIRELKAENVRLSNQLVQAKAENIALLDPLVKYINRKIAGKKHSTEEGIVDAVIAYCQEICAVNTRNLDACKQWEDRYLSEKKLREEREDELDEKKRELRAVEDKLPSLRSRVSELETREGSLRNEIERLEREKGSLERKCENQERRFENQKSQADGVIKRLEQTVAALEGQMGKQRESYEKRLAEQKEEYAVKMQRQREYYDAEVTGLHQQLDAQTSSHQAQLATATQELREEITTLRATHKQEKDQLESTFTEQFATLQKDHQTALARLKRQHHNATKSLRDKVSSLENDLVGNNDDFRPATDDSLKVSYRQLKLAVDMVTEPNNLGINGVPRGIGKIDTSRFLEREGRNQLRFLLRSVVWQRVVEGFFSEPFGMGALGSREAGGRGKGGERGGNGWEVLRGVVEGWRGLCGYSSDGLLANGKVSKPATDDFLAPFFHSREANKWRSATFQSILMAVAPPASSMSGSGNKASNNARKGASPSGTPGPPEHPTTTPYWANVNQVQTNIITLLSSICSESLSPEIQTKVSELCQQAGELALQFGAQRAQLALEVPKRGDQVTIGTESGWVDCEDGDSFGGRRGVEVEVDLCVSPKVYRVGDMDGRNLSMDRSKAKVKAIVAGEVYPRRS